DIDYLMWYDASKIPGLLRHMKGPQLADRDALEKTFGMKVPEIQRGFEQFVRDEYAARPRKDAYERPPRPKGD
ncbi:MAG: hypothetical protein KC466_02980, partial [Myxococcales bacterium]|nr:hypothetical protein [Myxococcales bacterium]